MQTVTEVDSLNFAKFLHIKKHWKNEMQPHTEFFQDNLLTFTSEKKIFKRGKRKF